MKHYDRPLPRSRRLDIRLLLLLAALGAHGATLDAQNGRPAARGSSSPRLDAAAPVEILARNQRHPVGVTVAPDGRVFFTDEEAGALFEIPKPGDRPRRLTDDLVRPRGVVWEGANRLLVVADALKTSARGRQWSRGRAVSHGVLLRFDLTRGDATVLADGLRRPRGLALGADGTVYVSAEGQYGRGDWYDRDEDDGRQRDWKWESQEDREERDEDDRDARIPISVGSVFRWTPGPGLQLVARGFRRPAALIVRPDGTLLVAARRFRDGRQRIEGTVFSIDPAGMVRVYVADALGSPAGLALDRTGGLFVSGLAREPRAGRYQGVLRKRRADGSVVAFATGLDEPQGLALAPDGALVAVDAHEGDVIRFLAPGPPVLQLTDDAATNQDPFGLRGTAAAGVQVIVLGGRDPASALARDGTFEVPVPLAHNQPGSLEVFAVGALGNGLASVPASLAIVHDDIAPTIAAAVSPPANVNGWNAGRVTVHFTCADSGSGFVACPPDRTIETEGVGLTVTGDVSDRAGNTASAASPPVNIDRTPPAVDVSLSPAPNADGVYAGPVTVHFACADEGAGIESCPADQVVSMPGADQTVSGTAYDRAGNATLATSDPFTIRISDPKITLTLSPAPNAGGWNNTPVVAHFTCTPDGAPIVTCPPDQVIDTEGANQTVSGTVVDANGNMASVTSEPFRIDLTPPAVASSLMPQPNANGWNNTPVTVSFECIDTGSGVVDCSSEQMVSTQGVGQIVTGTASDAAGNMATASATVNLDTTPPVLALSTPTTGTTVFTPSVTVSGLLTDGLSGVETASCNGSPALVNAGAITCVVSFMPGPNTVEATAVDRAGNSAMASLAYTYNAVPILTILQPANLSYTSISPTTITGTVDDPDATVTVNSIQAAAVGGGFSVALPLAEGPNTVTATAASATGAIGTATLTVTLDTTPPHVTVTSPPDRFVTVDPSIDVTGIVNDIVVGTVNAEQAGVTVNGVSAQVANRTFLAGNVALALGPNVIQVMGRDRVGNQATTQITVTREVPVAQARIQALSGNGQSGAIRSMLPAPLAVALTDAASNPVPDKPVIFKVTQNDGLVASGATPAPTVIATTDAQGRAQAQWTLGGRAGAGGNTVEAYAVGFEGTAIFTATGNQGPAGKIVVDTGNNQIGPIGQRLPRPFIAVVVDEGNNRLGGVPVTFTVSEGGGDFDGQPSLTVTSDPDGRVAGTLTLGMQEGNNNNLVSATFESNQGFPAAFTASGRFPGDPTRTSITGVVLDNSNIPIPGVTVRAVQTEVLHANGNAANAVTPVQTDAQGQFAIPQAPVGFVKLLVDGLTATLPGSYPTLDYDMVTVAGQINTVGQPIFLLPLNSANSLCVTDTTGGGTLTIPEAPGFSLTFGPGQVTFPGGSKTGCVSVTVVNREKVPMAPGFGQQPRFIVTIQPAGAVFNPPAPITLPNVDGLQPRAVTEMYSFDHDISSFVAIGTGTVSDDGLVIRSNTGVGVLKAGWHCGGNPEARGTVADCPPCNFCQAAAPGPGGPDQCVFDANQTACTGGPYNNCIVPGTGACAQDPTPGSYKGICVGGELQPDGTPCNAGGSMMAVCLDGICTGTGNQCPVACNDGNACTFDICANAECSAQPDISCQTQCIGQPDGTSCIAGGLQAGACYGGQCLGNGDQCPDTCNGGTCANGQCEDVCTGSPDDSPCGVDSVCHNGECKKKITLDLTWNGRPNPERAFIRQGSSHYSNQDFTVAPSVLGGTFQWASSNPSVLEVIPNDNSVSVRGLQSGVALLSVDYEVDGRTASAAVRVTVTYPIIFVHGMNSGASTWSNITATLQANYAMQRGAENCRSSSSELDFCTIDFGSEGLLEGSNTNFILEAPILAQRIQRVLDATGAEKVILVAHSMGGLVSRTVIQQPFPVFPQASKIDTLITIGTPHLGSIAAELPLRIFEALRLLFDRLSFLPAPTSSSVQSMRPDSLEMRTLNQNSAWLSRLISTPTKYVSIVSADPLLSAGIVTAWSAVGFVCGVSDVANPGSAVVALLAWLVANSDECQFVVNNYSRYVDFFLDSDLLVSRDSQDIASVPGMSPSRRQLDAAAQWHVAETSLIDEFRRNLLLPLTNGQ